MTDWSAPVPDDRIQPLNFEVTDWRTQAELIQKFESSHSGSEKIYNGDGSWGTGYSGQPLIRDTSRRVLGYIDAYRVTGKSIYKQRAKEGLDYLLLEQNPDGHFTEWQAGGANHGGGAYFYETGIAEAALIEGYKLFNKQSYLDAAKKAGQSHHKKVSGNANYRMFGAWGDASVYEVTGEQYYLDGAINHALYAVRNVGGSGYQLPSGGWSDDHNQIIWYHGIITRGLVKLLSVMPTDHSNYDDIEKATYKAMNHLRLRQLEDGKWLFESSDSAKHHWSGNCAQSVSMAITELNWPVEDSLHLASKGMGTGSIIAVGSMLRAYLDPDATPPTTKVKEYVWLEAEDANIITPDFGIASVTSASNGKYIQIPEGVGYRASDGVATYRISIDSADNYVIWGRKIAATKEDNSFFVQIVDGTEYLWVMPLSDNWQWDAVNHWGSSGEFNPEIDPVIFSLLAGEHTLKIKQREDGAKLDRLLITNDMGYVPTSVGDTTPPNGTPGFEAFFAIASLLAVSYSLMRRRKRGAEKL